MLKKPQLPVLRLLGALLLLVILVVFLRALSGMGWPLIAWAAIWFLAYSPSRLRGAHGPARPRGLPLILVILVCSVLLGLVLMRLVAG